MSWTGPPVCAGVTSGPWVQQVSTNVLEPRPCRWCSGAGASVTYHTGPCPRVKAIEYHPDGSVKRVEFRDDELSGDEHPGVGYGDAVKLYRGAKPGLVRAFIEVDAYEAINLLAALEIVADTGDWHGQMRYKLGLIAKDGRVGNRVAGPNVPVEDQLTQIRTASAG